MKKLKQKPMSRGRQKSVSQSAKGSPIPVDTSFLLQEGFMGKVGFNPE